MRWTSSWSSSSGSGRIRADDPPHRASDAAGHGHLRAARGPRFRRDHRRGPCRRRSSTTRTRPRGLPGGGCRKHERKTAMVLSVEDLTVAYGNIQAVNGISFDVARGRDRHPDRRERRGKSSTLSADLGYDRLRWPGRLPGPGPAGHRHAIGSSPCGIAHVPEGRGIFGNLTVMENLKLATWQRKDKAELAKDYKRVFDLFPVSRSGRDQPGGTLSGGEQQMLAVGRALMSRGRMMLLDEPSMGLAPVLVRDIFQILTEINRTGHDDPPGRAKRPHLPWRSFDRLCPGDGLHRAFGPGKISARRSGGSVGIPRPRVGPGAAGRFLRLPSLPSVHGPPTYRSTPPDPGPVRLVMHKNRRGRVSSTLLTTKE